MSAEGRKSSLAFQDRRMRFAQVFQVLCILAAVLILVDAACDATGRRFTLTDDIELVQFRQPFSDVPDPNVFSPDGRYFAVETERGLVGRNLLEDTISIFRTADVRQFLLHTDNSVGPSPIWTVSKSAHKDGPIITRMRWLADSSGIAFLAKSKSGNDQLSVADLKTREVRPLTQEGQHVAAFAIRNSRYFVFAVHSPNAHQMTNAKNHVTSFVGTGLSLSSILFDTSITSLREESELWAAVDGKRFRVEDSTTGKPFRIYRPGLDALSVSPDGLSLVTALPVTFIPPEWEALYLPPAPTSPSRIRAGPQDVEAPEQAPLVSEYVLIRVLTGKVERLTGAPIGNAVGWNGFTVADWSSDGKSVVLSNTFLSDRIKHEIHRPNQPCVAVVDLLKHTFACLERIGASTETDFHLIENAYFDRGNRNAVTIEYEIENSSRGAAQGSTSYVRSDEDSWSEVHAAQARFVETGPIEIHVQQDLNTPPVLVATDHNTGKSRAIWDPNPRLKDTDLGEASMFTWKDHTGRAWIGGLYKPPGYEKGRLYPLVIQTHGFAPNYFIPSGLFSTAFAARELAAADILVLQIQDCPYSATPDEGPCNIAGYEAAVEQLVHGAVVDPARVGILGFSRTCYYVLEALTASQLHWKAASITDGVNEGYWQYLASVDSSNNRLAHEYDSMVGARPFGDGLVLWIKRSPEFKIEKITTPLQVVALGPVSLLEMWEPYAALRYLGKPVDLIVLPKAAHIVTNPGHRIISQGGTVDWFRFWLQHYEDPDPAKAQQYARWRELRKMQQQNGTKSNETRSAPIH